jgi:hypothetical protein
MKYTSKSFFSLLLLASFSGFAQNKLPADTKADTITNKTIPVKTERYGIRVGLDLYRPARSLYEDGFQGFEAVADYRVSNRMYAAGELGTTNYTLDDAQVNFTTKGSYFKIGFDYNSYENWLDMENMIYIGLRYGFSTFSQNLNSYTIYDTTNYFEDVTVYPDKRYSGLTAHWAEVVGGIKAEIYDNLFIGFSVRLNVLLAETKPDNFDNLYIPGFNRTYDGGFGAGINYTVSYFIPFYKKQKLPETKPAKK